MLINANGWTNPFPWPVNIVVTSTQPYDNSHIKVVLYFLNFDPFELCCIFLQQSNVHLTAFFFFFLSTCLINVLR